MQQMVLILVGARLIQAVTFALIPEYALNFSTDHVDTIKHGSVEGVACFFGRIPLFDPGTGVRARYKTDWLVQHFGEMFAKTEAWPNTAIRPGHALRSKIVDLFLIEAEQCMMKIQKSRRDCFKGAVNGFFGEHPA